MNDLGFQSSWTTSTPVIVQEGIILIFKGRHNSIGPTLLLPLMVARHSITHLTVLPVLRIPSSLLPVDDAYNFQPTRLVRYDYISQSEIPMGEVYLALVGKPVPEMIFLDGTSWFRPLASCSGEDPVVKRLDVYKGPLLIV